MNETPPPDDPLKGLSPGFISHILSPSDTIDTSPEGLRRLAFNLSGPPRLATCNGQPAKSPSSGLRAVLSTVPNPAPAKPLLPSNIAALPFIEQISAMVGGEPASLHEFAEAIFRVNLTPRNAHIDIRPDGELNDREKLTIRTLATKLARRTAPATLEEATQLAVWRGTAQPLRF